MKKTRNRMINNVEYYIIYSFILFSNFGYVHGCGFGVRGDDPFIAAAAC